MINKDNLKELLKVLNFEEKDDVFSKVYYENPSAYLKVDFKKKILIYPTDKGFTVNGEFTCNFTSDENFVVFECINRLFEKGYKPEHIELEPKWKVGHGASGGRADILIKDNSAKSFLIIECKTDGYEFKKEWENTKLNGGQMLTYAKQAGSTQYVCLYSSDFEAQKISYKSNIISLKDNTNLLESLIDKKPMSFAEAKALEVEDIYSAWKNTYDLYFETKGIFESDIEPYKVGKQKHKLKDLNEIGSKDIQSKYHEFASIMRRYNVSGRENAFDKLVNLFLCKVVDEYENPDDLKFYWKGIANDSYFELQDRLQVLYQVGMDKFLEEKITNVNRSEIVNAFRYVKKDPDSTQETILKYFRQLKYFKNSDFSFIDVHNEGLFYQNSIVLLDVVKMLQDIRLTSDTQNQFLGDMFEGFLDNGVKQSEGQFFTPMPIVKFVVKSLPLQQLIINNEMPPKAVDYACGAGHFLNELALEIKQHVEVKKELPIEEYYKQIVGIEKEYRLSKVSKVSAFMYGQDDIKITYADALGKDTKVEDESFSVLVANPPYSVKGFLLTLSDEERKSYELTSTIDNKSIINNNCIEAFFIERAKQLLKPGGVAGIILPSSILSNESNIYVKTREIILEYFDIVSIVEFGSQTFGKTGTNTVTLFLRRKIDNPSPSNHWKYRVESWFNNNESAKIYEDNYKIIEYCKHIGIDEVDYKTILDGNPNEKLLASDMFLDYKKTFENQSEIKNLLKQRTYKLKTVVEQVKEINKRFSLFLQSIEKDKLYFFVIASENKQPVLVVKYGISTKEQQEFLGYKWSSAKGNEGIKYINQNLTSIDAEDEEAKEMLEKLYGLQSVNTPLYNSQNTNDKNKINKYILDNFNNLENFDVPDNLKKYVSFHNLTNMLDFERTDFNKQIVLTPRKNIPILIKSKWDLIKLENLMDIGRGASPRPIEQFITKNKNGINWIKIGDVEVGAKYITKTEEKITIEGAEKSRKVNKGDFILSNSMSFGRPYILKIDGCIHDGWLLLSNIDNRINTDYLYYILSSEDTQNQFNESALGGVVKNLNTDRVKSTLIPLPPKKIQEKIVLECCKIDEDVITAEKGILDIDQNVWDFINDNIINSNYPEIKIGNLTKTTSGGTPLSTINDYYYQGDIPWVNSGEVAQGNIYNTKKFITKLGLENSSAKIMPLETVLLAMYGATAGKVGVLKIEASSNQAVCGILPNEKFNSKFLFYQLRNMYEYLLSLRTGIARDNLSQDKIKAIKIKLPDMKTQLELVKQIEQMEQLKLNYENIIVLSNSKKRNVMERFLQ
ncbi:N-6 DNA methylase [Flavobacterium psychrophilum]|uniref:N-6 DNA methylase n=1 Tax=Flavobacterium psychrophilum TaxID=96345 RepID=UPI0004F82417|nr:N-6 DNA methylase [Flavobacterium psychrophilum]AIN73939.1 DNA methyltransferase [Flavobacterium psychrophilum FPG3]EKT2069458.1 N-6 DNA methylase [Flavobacterium psychrophilum]EKT2071721.1 N-6 DNA methylase [Flavobacterium psychrophilum]EKT4491242.1 N-6 DNA methylase [Flavobacterium psychrophilum]MBF2044549.1 N-6 DNA methylase [Flavobacterium psychrophilum]